jgi:hypothetical protein
MLPPAGESRPQTRQDELSANRSYSLLCVINHLIKGIAVHNKFES